MLTDELKEYTEEVHHASKKMSSNPNYDSERCDKVPIYPINTAQLTLIL